MTDLYVSGRGSPRLALTFSKQAVNYHDGQVDVVRS
jgi:hypothetical protein